MSLRHWPGLAHAATTFLLIALLMGCAGTRFSFENARQLSAGMTEAEVVKTMGRPYRTTVRGDIKIMTWVFVNGITGANRSMALPFKDGKLTETPRVPDDF